MSERLIFGYGSLVNRRTHDYRHEGVAEVRGWRRVWQPSPLRPVAYLTAVADPDGVIEGMVGAVPQADWGALDERERAYRLHEVVRARHRLGPEARLHIYAVEDANPPNREQPILLSYIDVVIEGYLIEFGVSGTERFFQTTHGWDTPVLNDRSSPRYPRHHPVPPKVTSIVDSWLRELGAELVAR